MIVWHGSAELMMKKLHLALAALLVVVLTSCLADADRGQVGGLGPGDSGAHGDPGWLSVDEGGPDLLVALDVGADAPDVGPDLLPDPGVEPPTCELSLELREDCWIHSEYG